MVNEETIRKNYLSLTDDELFRIVYVDFKDYEDKAIIIAKDMLQERQLGRKKYKKIAQNNKVDKSKKIFNISSRKKEKIGIILFFVLFNLDLLFIGGKHGKPLLEQHQPLTAIMISIGITTLAFIVSFVWEAIKEGFK